MLGEGGVCGFCCLRSAELVKPGRGGEVSTEDGGRTYVKMEGGVCGGIVCVVDRDWILALERVE
jgi:hypothetical protein